jgi:hypothetical protein
MRLSTSEQTAATVQSLQWSSIRTDGGTQPRAGIDEEHVARLREALLAGATLPSLMVFYDGTDYWLADGFHRMRALRSNGAETLLCEVRQGTRRDAVLWSVGANQAHGLPRSRDDLRRAIERLLRDDEWRQWSDREIARRVGCSHATVGTVRKSLEASGQIDQIDTRTATRNGITYTQAPKAPASDPGGDHVADVRRRAAAIGLMVVSHEDRYELIGSEPDLVRTYHHDRDGLGVPRDREGALIALNAFVMRLEEQALTAAAAPSGSTQPIAGLADRPLDEVELSDLSRLGRWEVDPSITAKPGKIVMRLHSGEWDTVEQRSPDGWRHELGRLRETEMAAFHERCRAGIRNALLSRDTHGAQGLIYSVPEGERQAWHNDYEIVKALGGVGHSHTARRGLAETIADPELREGLLTQLARTQAEVIKTWERMIDGAQSLGSLDGLVRQLAQADISGLDRHNLQQRSQARRTALEARDAAQSADDADFEALYGRLEGFLAQALERSPVQRSLQLALRGCDFDSGDIDEQTLWDALTEGLRDADIAELRWALEGEA